MKAVLVVDGRKRCSKCKQDLPTGQFNRYYRSASGLQSQCRVCSRTAAKVWDRLNPHRRSKINRRYREHRNEAK